MATETKAGRWQDPVSRKWFLVASRWREGAPRRVVEFRLLDEWLSRPLSSRPPRQWMVTSVAVQSSAGEQLKEQFGQEQQLLGTSFRESSKRNCGWRFAVLRALPTLVVPGLCVRTLLSAQILSRRKCC